MPDGEGPLRGLGTQREQRSKEIGGTSHERRFYGNLHNIHQSSSNFYGGTLASMEADIFSMEVAGRFNLLFTSMEINNFKQTFFMAMKVNFTSFHGSKILLPEAKLLQWKFCVRPRSKIYFHEIFHGGFSKAN